jgi:hypothetical protein
VSALPDNVTSRACSQRSKSSSNGPHLQYGDVSIWRLAPDGFVNDVQFSDAAQHLGGQGHMSLLAEPDRGRARAL